jgi:hypothetical protein
LRAPSFSWESLSSGPPEPIFWSLPAIVRLYPLHLLCTDPQLFPGMSIQSMEFSSIYSEGNRRRFLITAAVAVVAIAIVDWRTKPFISIGFPVSISHPSGCRLFATLANHFCGSGLLGPPGVIQRTPIQ